MVSLANLPDHGLQLVFDNINQHQAITLAPLHSSLYYATKRKLFNYIYVYDIQSNTNVNSRNGKSNVACALPNFRFPKHINNSYTNTCTIISLSTLKKYLHELDKSETITYFVMSYGPFEHVEKIVNHFKSIKHFIIGKIPFRDPQTESRFSKVLKEIRLRGNFSLRSYLAGDIRSYRHKSTLAKCFMLDSHWHNFLHHGSFGELLHVDIEPPGTLHKVLISIRCQWDFSRTKITSIYDTRSLREVFISGNGDLDDVFARFPMDNDFPNLKILGLSDSGRSVLLRSQMEKTFTRLSHKTVVNVIIATEFVNEEVAKGICELSLQFPKASINWTSSLVDIYSKTIFLEQMYRFSHVVPTGTIGILWSPETIECLEPIQSKYLVGTEEGVERTVEFVKYYSHTDITQLIMIYTSENYYGRGELQS
ncbi:hypothetical protein I9W82_004467 [Candida metapsilosis]|uniref:F-box domain-containing protein n=1 Tax=Candida metapsilosis TaxID=273372 RepID=A0A8H7ZA84_9ASCO|nr:hypothetical protein I9W82_004467 [Candida metapsilosis]